MAVHIFWDNSNIFIPAKFAASRRDGPMQEHSVRIQFDNMYRLASAARDVESAVCVGSVPPELEAVWDRLEATGVEVELYERGAGSGTEQGLDQCLQVHMLRALADSDEPAVAVLLTGDGAGSWRITCPTYEPQGRSQVASLARRAARASALTRQCTCRARTLSNETRACARPANNPRFTSRGPLGKASAGDW